MKAPIILALLGASEAIRFIAQDGKMSDQESDKFLHTI